MRYVKKIASPKHPELTAFFDQRFGKPEIHEGQALPLEYKTSINLKIDLRFEMNLHFPAQFHLQKEGLLTKIEISINPIKILFACLLMTGFITTIIYLIYPGFLSLIFGLIAGLIVYFMSMNQVNRELEKYMKNLLDETKPTNA